MSAYGQYYSEPRSELPALSRTQSFREFIFLIECIETKMSLPFKGTFFKRQKVSTSTKRQKKIIKDEKGESGIKRKNFLRLFRAFKLFNII